MSLLVLGFDPGSAEKSPGGMAWIGSNSTYGTMPLNTAEPLHIRDALVEHAFEGVYHQRIAAVESVSAWAPGGRIGSTSAMTIGRMVMGPEMACAMACIPVIKVLPQKWHPLVFNGRKKPKVKRTYKKIIYEAAKERWDRIEWGSFTGWSGAADALWIAQYARESKR